MAMNNHAPEETQDLIPLPPGWRIDPEPGVGVSCRDRSGWIVAQHPIDANHFRKLCWFKFYDEIACRVATLRGAKVAEATGLDRDIVMLVVRCLKGECDE